MLHWDGKLVPEMQGKERVDRLALVVTAENLEKLLGIPKVEDSSGERTAVAILDFLRKWKLDDLVEIVSFDTTATNTGIDKGAGYLLENKLGRDLLFLPCRHHISELLVKAVFELNFGKTSAPEVLLFNRFSKFWKNINTQDFKSGMLDEKVKKAISPTEAELLTKFCLAALQSHYVRAEYKELLQLSLLFIGEDVPDFSGFRPPSATSHARFMSKDLYCYKMFLFREQFVLTVIELNHLRSVCIFLTRLFVPYWFGCVNPVDAPRQDLQFIQDSIAYFDKRVSDALLHKIKNHLWYLSEETVALAFFDEKISLETRRKMARALNNGDDDEEYIPKRIDSKVPEMMTYADKDISHFVSPRTKRFFTRLAIDTGFLESDPTTWPDRGDYCAGKRICQHLAVVNDPAERAVKLISDFNRALTYDEEDKQFLLQVVEHYRKAYPSHTKSSLMT